MTTTRGRLVFQGETVFDQADFLQSDGFTRVLGITPGDLVLNVFHKNVVQPWLLVDGTLVTDSQVVSGQVYFNPIAGAPGFYGVRWRPSTVGYWRIVITYPVGIQMVGQEYDVLVQPQSEYVGLKTSFVKPNC